MTQQLHESHVFFQTDCLCVTLVSIRVCLNMSPWFVTIYDSLSLGNVFLFLLLLFLLHYLMVLYEFRNMPPGPRLTTLPVLGNIFSLDHKAKRFPDTFRRSVFKSQSSLLIDILIWGWPCTFWTCRNEHRKYKSTENHLQKHHHVVLRNMDKRVRLLHNVKLQRVQNAAARLLLNLSKYPHISLALYQLHWLPVQHRVHFKILILTFKAIHGLAPKYIIELINIKPRSIYNLRSNQSLLLDPPKGKMLVTLGDRSFSAAAPYLWNSLPAELRDIQSLAVFKCKLKTYLFRAAFTTEPV